MNALLLAMHAAACDEDTTLLLVMPTDQLPFTLDFGPFMEVDDPALPPIKYSHTFNAPAA